MMIVCGVAFTRCYLCRPQCGVMRRGDSGATSSQRGGLFSGARGRHSSARAFCRRAAALRWLVASNRPRRAARSSNGLLVGGLVLVLQDASIKGCGCGLVSVFCWGFGASGVWGGGAEWGRGRWCSMCLDMRSHNNRERKKKETWSRLRSVSGSPPQPSHLPPATGSG